MLLQTQNGGGCGNKGVLHWEALASTGLEADFLVGVCSSFFCLVTYFFCSPFSFLPDLEVPVDGLLAFSFFSYLCWLPFWEPLLGF